MLTDATVFAGNFRKKYFKGLFKYFAKNFALNLFFEAAAGSNRIPWFLITRKSISLEFAPSY